MDVDGGHESYGGHKSSAAAATDTQDLVNQLGSTLESVAASPNNVRLLRHQVDLMLDLGMVDEATDAIETATDIGFLGEKLWLKFLKAKVDAIAQPVSLESFADVLELFSKAEEEYLSAAVLTQHSRFLLRLVEGEEDANLQADLEVTEYLSPETVREMLRGINTRASGLMNQSQPLWQLWMDWELRLLDASHGEEKAEQIKHILDIYLDRLQVPQPTLDETSSAYSTFLSDHCPEEYETRMVQVTEVSQPAKAKWSTERRHGKMRVDFEEQLALNHDPAHQATTLLAYIDWETDPHAKKPRGRGPRLDIGLTRAVFERAALVYANAAAVSEEGSWVEEAVVGEGHGHMMETANAYKTAEALVWGRYVDWLKDTIGVEEADDLVELVRRATRACPTSGELWSRMLQILEAGTDVTGIETTVEKAKNIILGNSAPVSALVDVLYTHASVLRRRYKELESADDHPVFLNLTAALQLVVDNFKGGDPSLRLEKFFLSWAEAVASDLIPVVIALLEEPVKSPVKSRATSYQMAVLKAGVQARHGDVDGARSVYTTAIARADLDWPEAVYESFLMFENVYGTLESVRDAQAKIEHEQQKVNRRREKAAAEQAAQQAAAAEQYQAAVVAQMATAAAAVAPEASAAAPATNEVAAVETAAPPAAPAAAANAAPPTKESADHVMRDRENTTVLVTGLKKGTQPERVTTFFASCGYIRETTMLPSDEVAATDAAMVEFRNSAAVPAALDRDGKRMDDGSTVHVSMLWRATLYVTNFPQTMDDASLRVLFEQYGKILQTRWPSRKYADRRRFCYITMESPAAAQNALILHNFKVDGSAFPMQVLISDPSAKKKRSDASNFILFVGGLHAKTTEPEVKNLFSKYGTIASIKIGWDNVKRICKGFAFVEMATLEEAKAALEVNGQSYHGRGLKVEISDPNYSNKQRHDHSSSSKGGATGGPSTAGAKAAVERKARQVCLFNLPEGAQEGLLQQELEKIVPVKRLAIFAEKREAVVELESQVDAGLLLMRTEPFVFNGAEIAFGDQATVQAAVKQAEHKGHRHKAQPAAAAAAAAAPVPTSSLAFAPRARKAAKPLGKAYHTPKAAVASAPAPPKAGSGQDAFRAFMTATNEQRKDKLEAKVSNSAAAGAGEGDVAMGSPAAGTKRAVEEEQEGSPQAKRVKKD